MREKLILCVLQNRTSLDNPLQNVIPDGIGGALKRMAKSKGIRRSMTFDNDAFQANQTGAIVPTMIDALLESFQDG